MASPLDEKDSSDIHEERDTQEIMKEELQVKKDSFSAQDEKESVEPVAKVTLDAQDEKESLEVTMKDESPQMTQDSVDVEKETSSAEKSKEETKFSETEVEPEPILKSEMED